MYLFASYPTAAVLRGKLKPWCRGKACTENMLRWMVAPKGMHTKNVSSMEGPYVHRWSSDIVPRKACRYPGGCQARGGVEMTFGEVDLNTSWSEANQHLNGSGKGVERLSI
jgi:hypothetical protein